MLKTYFTGVIILIAAILFNGVIARVGITGWYGFLNDLAEKGGAVFRDLTVLDYAWLFILYPLLLGLSGVLANKLWSILFHA